MKNLNRYENYRTVISKAMGSEIKSQLVPSEYYLSLFLPTLRFGTASYIAFTCPQALFPVVSYGKPESWWMVSAKNGISQAFVPCVIKSFSSIDFKNTNSKIPDGQSFEDVEILHERITDLLSEMANPFFAGDNSKSKIKQVLYNNLIDFIDPALITVYEMLTPDFFKWLKN